MSQTMNAGVRRAGQSTVASLFRNRARLHPTLRALGTPDGHGHDYGALAERVTTACMEALRPHTAAVARTASSTGTWSD